MIAAPQMPGLWTTKRYFNIFYGIIRIKKRLHIRRVLSPPDHRVPREAGYVSMHADHRLFTAVITASS